MHIFYAHGGGLGHLTRINKLIKHFKIPVNNVIIITPSIFTKYFKAYQFIKIPWNGSIFNWHDSIKKIIESHQVTAFYIDTFPFGIKGELISIYETFPKLKYIYISRLLKWKNYLDAISETIPITFSETITLEVLYPEHITWIKKHSKKITSIKLISNHLPPIPYKSPYILVVHSGGKADVLKICNKAIKRYKNVDEITILVFTQVDITLNDSRIIIHKDVYPISMYFKHAQKIYTAAGFNSIQELEPYKEKHIIIPFKKLFDDQFFRHANR